MFTAEGVEQIHDRFDKYDVPRETQERLIEKLNNAEMWDSTTGKVDPTSSKTLSNGEVVDTYPDGSIAVTSIEKPDEAAPSSGIETRGVSKCQAGSTKSDGYKRRLNCQVNVNWIWINQSFEADYAVKSGSPGKILDVRNPVYWVSPGPHFEKPTLKVTRSKADGGAPATARMTNRLAVGWGDLSAGMPLWVQLNVTTKAWSSHN